MLFAPPDDDALYAALLARDAAYEGRAFVGVSSTGVFCRLTCPARKPRRENCRFFETAAACIDAGFRPCLRCRPLHALAEAEPAVRALLDALEAAPGRRWTEADVAAAGYDPSTVRRAFRRAFGVTFLEMARRRRLLSGMGALESGGKVIEAQMDAGFDSPAAFRAACARFLGRPPAALKARPDTAAGLRMDRVDTPLGPMIAVADRRALHLLEFPERKALPAELRRLSSMVKGDLSLGRTEATEQAAAELADYFAGARRRFDTPLALHGSPFQREVWRRLQAIPAGETRSYGDLARAMGRPDAARAVAGANGANSIAIIVPCHRVIGADGALTGYGGGLWRKRRLLEIERRNAELQERTVS